MKPTDLRFIILALFVPTIISPAQGAILSGADFAQSQLDYQLCLPNNPQQLCYNILWDPAFIESGSLTVDIVPGDGDTSRYGRVIKTTFFNGYTGAGPFQRFDLQDRIRFDVPIVATGDTPTDPQGSLKFVELQLKDDGAGPTVATYIISGENLVDNEGNPLDPTPKVIIGGFNIDLTTDQEVPAPSIPGGFDPFGKARFELDEGTNEMTIEGQFSGMTSQVVGAHLHGPAGPGETAGVIFGLEFDDTGGVGTFEGTATLTDDQVDYLLAGRTYINVHTELNGPGEIRGQIAIPEPSSIVLLGIGMMAIAGIRRRKA